MLEDLLGVAGSRARAAVRIRGHRLAQGGSDPPQVYLEGGLGVARGHIPIAVDVSQPAAGHEREIGAAGDGQEFIIEVVGVVVEPERAHLGSGVGEAVDLECDLGQASGARCRNGRPADSPDLEKAGGRGVDRDGPISGQAAGRGPDILEKLDAGQIESLDGSVEWVIKKNLAENASDYVLENGLDEEAARIAILNQYMAVTDPLYDELVEANKIKTIVSEEAVEKAFYDAPKESRGTLRVKLAHEFNDTVKTISWSYLKLNPRIRYEPFTFNELDGWTENKIQELIDEIRSNIK